MKTQLIPLEPHDDLISIRDKMTWSKTPRILLVWPIRERVNLRPLDLKLLQRHAAALGAQLGLVTTDGVIKATARALGIPTFKTSSQARQSVWRSAPRPGIARRVSRGAARAMRLRSCPTDPLAVRHPFLRLLAFAVGVVAVLALALIFVPSAQITLTPAVTTQTLTLPVSAAPDVDTVYLSGSLPARAITVQVEASATHLSSGQVSVPDQFAEGQVEFTKIVFGPLTIPAGTVIRNPGGSGPRFATLEALDLPEGENQKGQVMVRALEPGMQGNLPAGQLTAIEGGLGLLVTVTNPQPTTGGSDILRPTPTAADVAALREQLLRRLSAQALTSIKTQLLGTDILFPETLTLIQLLEQESTPAPGGPGSSFTLRLRAEYQALYAASADLTFLARAALDAALPPGYEPIPESLSVSAVAAPVSGPGGVSRWQMR
ncbi:MAG: baseplate J/gp47 family protein, partial [Anaerolineales bacterium]